MKGKILVGNSGGEMGIRGWVTALDENTGKIVWRGLFHRSGQGCADRRALPPLLYRRTRQGSGRQDLATRALAGRAADRSGAGSATTPRPISSFMAPAIPGRGIPTSAKATINGPPPFSPAMPIRARRYGPIQLNPHDLYDYDEINENLLLDLPINGQTRPVLVHPGRDGFMFVIDRADRPDLFRRQIRHPDVDQVLRPQDRTARS